MLRGILGRIMGGGRARGVGGTTRPAGGAAAGRNAGVERGARSLLRGFSRRRRI